MNDRDLLQGNKLGITNPLELAKEEERLSKLRAIELWEQLLSQDSLWVGEFEELAQIHGWIFQDVYTFAGETRRIDISKGSFRFASVIYLPQTLEYVSDMPQNTYEEIIRKYVEMNVAHPFREGNGRATRLWLDTILRRELKLVIDWSALDKREYLDAMERSPINDLELRFLLQGALTDRIYDSTVFLKGLDASYFFEGYTAYFSEKLADRY